MASTKTEPISQTASTQTWERANRCEMQLELSKPKLPLGLSVELPGGRSMSVVQGGIRLPYRHTEVFSTADSYTTSAQFHIALGERPLMRDNLTLCWMRIRNVRWGSAGIPKLELMFEVSGTGRLVISTNNADRKRDDVEVRIERTRVTASEIEAFIRRAEAERAQDEEHARTIEEMLDAYRLLDDVRDIHSIAKRKMTFGQKRAYKAACTRMSKALAVLPPDATDESMARLREAVEAMLAERQELLRLKKEVEKWWR